MARPKSSASEDTTATIGSEQKLRLTADKLRNNVDSAKYSRANRDKQAKPARRANAEARVNHVVLGLILLKYISDTFAEHRAKLLAGQGDYAGANAEDPDEYKAHVFWVPAEARWFHLQTNAKQPWLRHFIHHLVPRGIANFVLANGSMSSNRSAVRAL